MSKVLVFLLIGSILLAGCSNAPTTINEPLPTETQQQPTSTPQPIATPTTIVYGQLNATVPIEALNIRSGPGVTFKQITGAQENTPLVVMGRALGDEWVLVRTPNNFVGWAWAEYIEISGSLDELPYMLPQDAILIQGRVEDDNGKAIPGVDVAIHQGTGANEVRTDAYSDELGNFYGYIPTSSSGTWRVEIVGVLTTSWIMNPDQTYKGAFQAMIIDTNVPPSTPLVFIFVSSN